jgi:uroporphyrinogen decarboxylase
MMSLGLPESTIKGAYVSGPYSLAALIMGADEAAMATVLNPEELHELCHFATEKIQQYIRLLIAAGAQAICILEPSAVMLGPDPFTAFSADYVRTIVDSCQFTGVATIYHTCGNTMHLIDRMADSGIDAISLDSASAGVDLPKAARELTGDVAIMGNLNPTGTIYSGSPGEVEAEVKDLMKQMEPFQNFILSTGCDLPQDTPIENISAFMKAGREYKA